MVETSCLFAYLIGIDANQVNEVFMGNVCQAGQGQAPSRQAALGAGERHRVRFRVGGKQQINWQFDFSLRKVTYKGLKLLDTV